MTSPKPSPSELADWLEGYAARDAAFKLMPEQCLLAAKAIRLAEASDIYSQVEGFAGCGSEEALDALAAFRAARDAAK